MEGLRGFAAILVFLVHFHSLFGNFATPGLHAVFQVLASLGHTGVDLFFVLSGYLMYGIVLSPKFQYGHYFVRRVKRLYPVFAAVLLFYVIAMYSGLAPNKIPAGFTRGVAVSACESGDAAWNDRNCGNYYSRVVPEL